MHTIVSNTQFANSPGGDDNDLAPARRGRSKVNPTSLWSTYEVYELATKYLLPSFDDEDLSYSSVVPTPPPSLMPQAVPANYSIPANREGVRIQWKESEDTKQTKQTKEGKQSEKSNCPKRLPPDQMNAPMERKELNSSKGLKEPTTSAPTPIPAVKANGSNKPNDANEALAPPKMSNPQYPAYARSDSNKPHAPPAPEDDVDSMYQAALLFLHSYKPVKSNVSTIKELEIPTEGKVENVVLCASSPSTASVKSVPDATRPSILKKTSGISPVSNPQDSIAGNRTALDIKSEFDKPRVAQGAQLIQSEHSPRDASDANDALKVTREDLTTNTGGLSLNARVSLTALGTRNKLNGTPRPISKPKSVRFSIPPPSPSPELALLPGLFKQPGSSELALGGPPNAPKLKPAAPPSPERCEEFEPIQLTPSDDGILEDEWSEELLPGDLLLEAYWARAEEEDRSELSSTDCSDEDEQDSGIGIITKPHTRPITRQEYVHSDDEDDDTSDSSDTLYDYDERNYDRDHYFGLDENDRLTPATLERVDYEDCTLSGGPHQPGDIVNGLEIDVLSSHCHTVNGRLLECGQLSCGCVIPINKCGPVCKKHVENCQTTTQKEGMEGTLSHKRREKSKKRQDVWFCPCSLILNGVDEDEGNILFCPFYIDNSDYSQKKRGLEMDFHSLEQERNQHLWEDHNLGKCTHKLKEHSGGTVVRSNQLRRYHEVKDNGVHFVRATAKGKKCAVMEEKMIAELQCGCIIDVPRNTSAKHPLFCLDCKKRQKEFADWEKAGKSPKAIFSFRKKRPIVTLCNKVRLDDSV
ncbi:hypothetical protein BZA77DRAFT_294318 [Pyronema omphalodes]|nr:hypothetical protein BZA77DRAFT_294318 [Pyronema omphalodes]